MRKFVWICDRCGAEIEPRVLDKGEMYLTRKKSDDVDLCENCLKSLAVWFATTNPCDAINSYEWIPIPLKTLDGDDIVAYESSCCRAIADKKYHHCPKCGAKMDGGEE